MAIQDFLFNGAPSPAVTSFQTSTQQLPPWFEQYAMGILAKGNSAAGVPSADYFANRPPQVAGFTADQTSAFDATRANQGATLPMLGDARSLISGAGATSPLALGGGLVNTAGGADIAGAGAPFISQAAGYNPFAAGAGYLGQAAQTFPGAVSDYMSPYTDAVVNRIGELGARNLSENLLPAVNDTFTGAGQFGSRRHADFTNRALRDVNESVLGQQAQALEQGYGQAAQIFGQDQSRLAGLGATAGQLAGATQSGLANLGQLSGQLASSQASNQLQAGQALGNLGAADAATQLAAGQGLGNLANTQQGIQLRDTAALEQIGQTQQALNQQNLNAANANWAEERDYDRTNLAFLNSLLRGMEVPVSTQQTYSGPGSIYQPSGLAQLASALGTYGALKNVI